MKLERKFGAGNAPVHRMGWLSGALLFALALTAVPEVALAQFPVEIGSTTMNRNRAIVTIANGVGQAGSIASGSSVGNGGFWITTQNPYIFAAGPTIGARIPGPGGAGLDTVAFIGGPFSQVLPGSTSDPKLANVGGAGVLWDTANPDPAVIEQFPADCTVDATRVAQFPSLGSFQGLPFPGFADQTVCVATNDIQGAVCDDCAGTRMGVEVISTWFAFSVPEVQDFIFFIFRIYNRSELINATNSPNQVSGPYNLEDVTVAIAADPDIGDSADDQITFFPAINTMVAWDSNFNEGAEGFIGTPGFVAFNYLRTPIDPATGEEVGLANFTLFSRTGGRPDPENPQEWYQGLTGDPGFSLLTIEPTDIRGMASSALFDLPTGEFVEIYGAIFFAPVQGAPPEILLAEAPFVQQGGQLVVDPTANFDQGTAPGNPFELIIQTQGTAQTVFDLGFVVPTAPPKPDFELIPGDSQVTIVWNDNSVEGVSPFAKVARDPFQRLANNQPDPAGEGQGIFLEADAVIFDPNRDQGGLTGFLTAAEAGLTGREVTNPAYNPGFVIQDFQGFNVYRSRTGSPEDAELIAQFDLADAISGPGPFCFAAEEVFSGGAFVDAVCTDIRELPIGGNTGLAFAIVDRGGEFPSPSTGSGLINGIPVAYAVTAFAVNPGQSPVGILSDEGFAALVPEAAPLILESGLLPFQRATPRSNSTALRAESVTLEALTEDGSVCDAEEATATVDPNTGEYVDFRDCSNAIVDLTLQSIRPENLPNEDFFLVIDSLTTESCCPYAIAAGGNQVWFHWEDAGGGLSTLIQPNVGSFNQEMDFAFSGTAAAAFGLDTNPDETGADLGFSVTVGVDASVIEDLEVNGQSLALLELGGTKVGEARPHRIDGSSLADVVVIGNARDGGGGSSREYSQPFPYAQGGTSYELTWSVEGGTYSGTLVQLPGRNVVPEGGQPKGPDNPSTPGDFIAGWNWGFLAPDTPDAIASRIMPATPLTNSINLTPGATFAIFVPGQSVTIQGIQTLPQDGDVWTFLIDSGFQRGFFGRDPGEDTAFVYNDFNTESAQGIAYPIEAGVTNVYPGARWKLSIQGGSNELADADLSQIRVVPNPFIVTNAASLGVGRQNILFTNLPPQATIRIYTISGNLIRVVEHSNGSGTEEWDARTRFDLVVASGNYYFHVTTPDGRTHLGRFAVVN